MYVTFVRLILEYASVVWDGCSILDTDKLEKVQLYVARIVTGLQKNLYILKLVGSHYGKEEGKLN